MEKDRDMGRDREAELKKMAERRELTWDVLKKYIEEEAPETIRTWTPVRKTVIDDNSADADNPYVMGCTVTANEDGTYTTQLWQEIVEPEGVYEEFNHEDEQAAMFLGLMMWLL